MNQSTASGGNHDRALTQDVGEEFHHFYGSYLDSIYCGPAGADYGSGRQTLIDSVAEKINEVGSTRILDCAAGTGFPALGLKRSLSSGHTVHTTDASRGMLRGLARRAESRNIDISELAPERKSSPGGLVGIDALLLDWSDLDQLEGEYDYVMCRGNSLLYANSWGPDHPEVASKELIEEDLAKIAGRVAPGGYLHVDVPRIPDMSVITYRPVTSGAVTFTEEVRVAKKHRHWRLDVELPTDQKIQFNLYSTPLAPKDIQAMLDKLGLESLDLVSLEGERRGLGVIIARKPG